MTNDDWRQVLQWLTDLGLTVVHVDPTSERVTVQLPTSGNGQPSPAYPLTVPG